MIRINIKGTPWQTFRYKESDFTNYEEFEIIETIIMSTRNEIYNLGYTDIPEFNPIYLGWYSFTFYTLLNEFEDAIANIGKYYFRPKGWIKTKTWMPNMSISYKDMNRWLNNLYLINERLDNESSELLPRNDLYPSDSLLPH